MNSIQYRPTADNTGFEPVVVADASSSIQQNNAALSSAESQYLTSIQSNRNTAIKNAERQGEVFEALSSLSKTASEYLEQETERRAESDMQEGMMLAYTQGVPEDEQNAFNDEEARLVEADAQTNTAGAEYERETGDFQTGQRIRGLSGWKAYGYARGLAERGGFSYPAYFEQAKDQVVVMINGQEVTYNSAADGSERAIVEQKIRGQYLSQYRDINPALLNKYLFPQMQSFEAKEFSRWNRVQGEKIKADRLAESKDELFTAFRSGQGAQSYEEFIRRNQGDLGKAGARDAFFEVASEFVSDTSIPLSERAQFVDGLSNSPIADYTSRTPGATTTLGKLSGRQIGALRKQLTDAVEADTSDRLSARQRDELDAQEQFESAVEANGGLLSDDQLRKAVQNYAAANPGKPIPRWLSNYKTREDFNKDLEKERIEYALAERGYLIESDFEGMSASTKAAYNTQIKRDAEFAPSESETKKAQRLIDAFAKGKSQTTIGNDGLGNEAYETIRLNAGARYQELYRSYRQGGANEQQAQANALRDVEKEIKDGTIKPVLPSGSDGYSVTEYTAAQQQLDQDPTAWRTQVLTGTETSLENLQKYRDTGVGRIPTIYETIASSQKGVTAWDVADAQLRAATGTGLMPSPMQSVETVNPEVERLLRFRPSPARTSRAAVSATGGKPQAFLDLVASVESSAHGYYDAYNLGGSNNGHTAHGSGNSAQDNRFGAPLSQLTVAEVMNLHSSGRLWAAGKYQFTPDPLRETVAYIGLDPSRPFDAATQDALALGRLRWRNQVDPGLAGLRREWIGLNNVSDDEIMSALIGVLPYYSQPENLTPGL